MAEQDETAALKEQDAILPEAKEDPTTDSSATDPLLSQDVKEREHHFNPTTTATEIPEDAGDLDDIFGGDDDELGLEPPNLEPQEKESLEAPDLDTMQVDPENLTHTLDPESPAGLSSSASEFGWEIIQNTLPDLVHELARMEKREVDKILSKIHARCGDDEARVIEEINAEFRKGLALSASHNQMGKEAMRQLFVSKGIEKKIAYKRFRRQKRDLFDRLEYLVKLQLKDQGKTEEKSSKQQPTEKE